MLEDNTLTLQTMASSQYARFFADDLRYWEKTLNLIQETIGQWQMVQRKWMYLEGIFLGSDDMRIQLPEPARRFDKVDSTWKKIMQQTHKSPNVKEACTQENRLEILRGLSVELDRCQKSLSDYLETKRCAFSRFFFISDDELLSILGSGTPQV